MNLRARRSGVACGTTKKPDITNKQTTPMKVKVKITHLAPSEDGVNVTIVPSQSPGIASTLHIPKGEAEGLLGGLGENSAAEFDLTIVPVKPVEEALQSGEPQGAQTEGAPQGAQTEGEQQ